MATTTSAPQGDVPARPAVSPGSKRAAKYSWLGPARLVSAIGDDLGASSYGQDTSAASRMQRLAGLAALLADWSASVLG